MSRRIEGIRQGARRRRRTLLAAIVSIGALGVFALTAAAVHDLDFQLDRNIATSPDTNVGGTTQEIDWQDLFNAAGAQILPLPSGFTASGFDRDFVTNANGSFNTWDNTTFATGSKDTLAITPGWQCNYGQQRPEQERRDERLCGVVRGRDGDEILYFALERNANTGTANVAFWFLQDENVNCVWGAAPPRSPATTSTATSWSCPSSRKAASSPRSRRVSRPRLGVRRGETSPIRS